MQLNQGNIKLSLENARGFLRANARAIGNAVPEPARRKLDEAIEGLADHASTHDAHSRAAAGALYERRRKRDIVLRVHMAPIAKIAALELPRDGKLVALTLPKKRMSVEQLAVLANGMASAASEHADVFIASGLTPDFADRLRSAAADMLGLTAEYKQNTYVSKQAHTNLRRQLSRGRKVIHMLDALMKAAFADDTGLLDAWKMAKRVQKKGYPSASTPPDGSVTAQSPTNHQE